MAKVSSMTRESSKEHPGNPTTERILSIVPPSTETLPPSEDESVRIATRAYELWEHRGWDHGHDVEDWFEAERAIRAK